jgi:hypothetical protein
MPKKSNSRHFRNFRPLLARRRPITLAPPNDLLELAVTEGIEDGLSVYRATHFRTEPRDRAG